MIGGEALHDHWKEEHDNRCKSLFDCFAKDASVPEDRRTSLTVGSLRERCSVGVQDVSVMQMALEQKDWW